MTIHHRRIPVLPKRPVHYPVAGHIRRSYPVGRQSFSRACKGETITLTISTEEPLQKNLQANLITTMNSSQDLTESFPFKLINEHTLECHIKVKRPGLHSFRTEFSLDNGVSWFRDTVPDAWILIDPPQVDALRMYTVIPIVSGSVNEWKADLKRIKEMGFNAVHLLPLTSLDTSESPYSAKNLFDIDPCYLDSNSSKNGLQQLEEYVEEAKALEIRLCFDLVLNHIGIHSNIAKQAPDWIMPDPNQTDGLRRARCWTNIGWHYWNDLALINYEHPSDAIRNEIWAYMTDYALFWAKYANETGGFVRFDNLHSSHPDFVQSLTQALHTEFPNVGILAEYFADETTLLHTGPKWGLNLNLATPWDYKFVPQLREYLNYIHRVSKHIRYFMPITSHDSGAPAQEFGNAESTVPRYVAAALLGTGATGIIQGVEFGHHEKINFIGRKPKIKFKFEATYALFIGKINSLLDQYPAFRRGENCQFIDNGHDAIIAAFREDNTPQTYGFIVVCNFDIYGYQSVWINLDQLIEVKGPVSYRELISEQVGAFANPLLEIMLPPTSAKVFMLLK